MLLRADLSIFGARGERLFKKRHSTDPNTGPSPPPSPGPPAALSAGVPLPATRPALWQSMGSSLRSTRELYALGNEANSLSSWPCPLTAQPDWATDCGFASDPRQEVPCAFGSRGCHHSSQSCQCARCASLGAECRESAPPTARQAPRPGRRRDKRRPCPACARVVVWSSRPHKSQVPATNLQHAHGFAPRTPVVPPTPPVAIAIALVPPPRPARPGCTRPPASGSSTRLVATGYGLAWRAWLC
jgi:hypothetical protein